MITVDTFSAMWVEVLALWVVEWGAASRYEGVQIFLTDLRLEICILGHTRRSGPPREAISPLVFFAGPVGDCQIK